METGIGKVLADVVVATIDKWYSMALLIGIAGAFACMFFDIWPDRGLVMLTSACLFFLGCGEGETRKQTPAGEVRSGFVVEGVIKYREWTPIGVLLYALAAVFGGFAIYRALVVFG